MRQAHGEGALVGPLSGECQHNRRAHGHDPERQRLLQQVRLALAFPGPPRQDITHGRADQPGGERRTPGRPAERPQAHRQRDLAGDDRPRRHQDEPAEPLADGGLEPALYGRADPSRSRNHAASSLRGPVVCGRRRGWWVPVAEAGGLRAVNLATVSRLRALRSQSAPSGAGLYRPYLAQVTPPIKAQTTPGPSPACRTPARAGTAVPCRASPGVPPAGVAGESGGAPGGAARVVRVQAGRPASRPSLVAAWSKNAARSVTTFSNWPNNSKLTRPNSPDQAISAPAATSSGTPARTASRSRAASGTNDSGTGGPETAPLACFVAGPGAPEALVRYASPMIFPNTVAARDAGPIVRSGAWYPGTGEP